jgi:hypothetical protein
MILGGQASFSPDRPVFARPVVGPAKIGFSANQRAVLRALEDNARFVRLMPLDDGRRPWAGRRPARVRRTEAIMTLSQAVSWPELEYPERILGCTMDY